jgi:hypothetical protein
MICGWMQLPPRPLAPANFIRTVIGQCAALAGYICMQASSNSIHYFFTSHLLSIWLITKTDTNTNIHLIWKYTCPGRCGAQSRPDPASIQKDLVQGQGDVGLYRTSGHFDTQLLADE